MQTELTEEDINTIRSQMLKEERSGIFAFVLICFVLLFIFFRRTRSGNTILEWETYGWLVYSFAGFMVICAFAGYIYAYNTVNFNIKNDIKNYVKVQIDGEIIKSTSRKNINVLASNGFKFSVKANDKVKFKIRDRVIIFYEAYTVTFLDMVKN